MEINGRSILNAAQKVSDLKGKGYSDSTHSVYLITGVSRMKLTPFATKITSVNRTTNTAVKESSVLVKPYCIESMEFVVLANDSLPSLSHKSVGGNFPSNSNNRAVDHAKALLSTSIEQQSSEVKKTLDTIAKGIFSGQARAFIRVLLKSSSTSSNQKVSAADLLSEVNYSVVKQFISSLANECNMEEVMDLTTATALVSTQMISITSDMWLAFKASKTIATTLLPTTSNSNSLFLEDNVVSPPQLLQTSIWSFLGNSECPVYKMVNENAVCVDIKDFSAYSIRNVDLQLQKKFSTHEVGSVFRVDRFSKEDGNLEQGKFLNGKFQGMGNVEKVSHMLFLIQDDASPDN